MLLVKDLPVQQYVQEAVLTKDRRREVRLTTRDDDLLIEAAGLQGVSVTEFMLNTAVADAEKVVTTHHTIELGTRAYKDFLAALDAPAVAPPERLDHPGRRLPSSTLMSKGGLHTLTTPPAWQVKWGA